MENIFKAIFSNTCWDMLSNSLLQGLSGPTYVVIFTLFIILLNYRTYSKLGNRLYELILALVVEVIMKRELVEK